MVEYNKKTVCANISRTIWGAINNGKDPKIFYVLTETENLFRLPSSPSVRYAPPPPRYRARAIA